MQVRDNSIVVYYEQMFSRRFCNNRAARNRMHAARKGQYSGKMTEGARKRMVKAVTMMCMATSPKWVFNEVTGQYHFHRLSFVTLTVANSGNMSAREGYQKLLQHFLQWLRRTKGVKMYIWKAELQERGQLHYHITMPDFIHWKEIRDEWNRIQKDAGLLNDFAEQHGHTDPNSTDVHDVRKVRNMAGYIVKEIAKSMQNQDATDGKIWDCSNNLSSAKYFSLVMTADHQSVIEAMRGTKEIRETKDPNGWWSVVYFSDSSPPDLLLRGDERKKFNDHLKGITGDLVQPDLFIEIPAAVVADGIDCEESYTWEQMKLFFN